MRTYERSGITVDQCTECRGVFLDRGELDRLIDAEAAFVADATRAAAPQAAAPPAPVPQPAAPAPSYPPAPPPAYDSRYDDRGRYDDRYDDRHYGKKKKRSFLDDLFD